MATYAIGDLQGCFRPLMRLLEEIEFDPEHDRLWIVGDLVNRGPASLEVLRWCYANRAHITTVLGNHDIYLIARALGAVPKKKRDTLDDIIESEDGPVLLEWLRSRPLIHRDGQWLMVHAGLHPEWTTDQAQSYARDIESRIQSGYRPAVASLLEPAPLRLDDAMSAADTRRFALAVMTRMRMCHADGALDFDYKGRPADAPPSLHPWFSRLATVDRDFTLVFGHWAALGLHIDERVIGLDSGCVWGRALTAVRLDDRAVFKVPCGAEPIEVRP